MYLPKSKYKVIVVPPGRYTLNGEDYSGPVLIDYRGNTYAGDSPTAVIGPVLSSTFDSQEVKSIVPIRRLPTEEEYQTGSMTRYFRQDIRTKKIDEISESSDEPGYNYVVVDWILRGPLDDSVQRVKGLAAITIEGARSKNARTLKELDSKLPGFSTSTLISGPEEFVK